MNNQKKMFLEKGTIFKSPLSKIEVGRFVQYKVLGVTVDLRRSSPIWRICKFESKKQMLIPEDLHTPGFSLFI